MKAVGSQPRLHSSASLRETQRNGSKPVACGGQGGIRKSLMSMFRSIPRTWGQMASSPVFRQWPARARPVQRRAAKNFCRRPILPVCAWAGWMSSDHLVGQAASATTSSSFPLGHESFNDNNSWRRGKFSVVAGLGHQALDTRSPSQARARPGFGQCFTHFSSLKCLIVLR